MQCSFQAPATVLGRSPLSVVIARGLHLFPFRTEQLSPSAPMVLGPRGPGRVGRRRSSLGPPLEAALRFAGPTGSAGHAGAGASCRCAALAWLGRGTRAGALHGPPDP